jgi:hypothetical protein
MLQNDLLFIVVSIIAVTVIVLTIVALWRRDMSNQKVGYSVDEIRMKFYPELECDRFAEAWPEFCKLVGTRNAYEYLDNKTPIFEKYFPISDLYYENLETFLVRDDGDISELKVQQLFHLFYLRRSNE